MTDLSQIQFQRDALRSQKQLEEWAIAIFTASSVALTFAPVFSRDAPKWTRTLFHTAGATAGALATYAAMSSEKRQKLYSTLENIELDALRSQFQNTAATISIANTLQGQVAAVNAIAAQPLPPMARLQLARQQGLGELFVSMYGEFLPQTPQPVTVEAVASPASAQPIAIKPGEAVVDLTARDKAIDYSWIDDPKFVRASKAVFAPKGSGKSFLISYLAAKFVEQNPDGILWIIDPHFNQHSAEYSNDPDDMETVWLNGIPKSELYCGDGKLKQRGLVKDPDSAYKTFMAFGKIMRDRVARGAKKEAPVHIICDEFENRLRQWSDDQAKDVLDVIAECEDEWRKYGGGVTVSMHSIKKGNTGIDSSIVFQMHLLALGGALADTTVKWPSDLDASKMAVARNELNESLNNRTEGYAAVLRKLNSSPQLVVIPPIDPYAFHFAIDGTVGTETVSVPTEATQTNGGGTGINWLDNLEAQLPEKPTVGQVKAAYETLTGKALDEGQLPYLLKLLQDRSWEIGNE